jgi:TonB family protein
MACVAIAAWAAALAAQGGNDLAAPPSGAPSAPHVAVITKPVWTNVPTAEDLAFFYPRNARLSGIGGRADMRCRIAVDGSLVDCEVIKETPEGEGFGSAALKTVGYFRMRPSAPDGRSLAGSFVTFALRFSLAGG